jgi:predicted PurR-regulated permease PerM
VRSLGLGAIGQVALVVAILALGKPVLVPVALAFYFAFVLTPPCDGLERAGLPRALSVSAVVCAALALVAVLGTVLVTQASDLAMQLQTYSAQMAQKLSGIRESGIGAFAALSSALSALSEKLDPDQALEQPAPVRIVSQGLPTFQRIEETLGPIVQPVATIAIVLVMTIFMLGHREDLRGRLIQLVGPQNLTIATRTMAEAVNRVSHFLLTQAYINASYGAVMALGLYLVGIPYAVLWGVLAGLLRFVPMFGALIGPIFPALVAFAIFPGWSEVLMTIALFLVADAIVANFVEPVVLGKRTGISALALLISALFWTWLWGPAGLILATPLTVCAAVVGRHVPELSFLAIALGDQAGLDAQVNFYQRMLAKATKDAYRLAKRSATDTSLPETLDELLVPSLGLMVADQGLHAISQDVADRVVQDIGAIAERLDEAEPRPRATPVHRKIVGVPAESSADSLLLRMLQMTLAQRAGALTIFERANRAALLAQVRDAKPDRVCISALPPSGNANARFLCRRLRAELPNTYIVVLLPEAPSKRSREAAARLREAGANDIAYDLREAAGLLSDAPGGTAVSAVINNANAPTGTESPATTTG